MTSSVGMYRRESQVDVAKMGYRNSNAERNDPYAIMYINRDGGVAPTTRSKLTICSNNMAMDESSSNYLRDDAERLQMFIMF
jgi:hypothetical protein